jgi:hypothetical protein
LIYQTIDSNFLLARTAIQQVTKKVELQSEAAANRDSNPDCGLERARRTIIVHVLDRRAESAMGNGRRKRKASCV